MESSSSRKLWSRISSTRFPGLLSGKWGSGTCFIGFCLLLSFDFRELSSHATSDWCFLPAGEMQFRRGRKCVSEAKAVHFCISTRRAPRDFSRLQHLIALCQCPFISPSSSCTWEHRNGSVPFLNSSSENAPQRKAPVSYTSSSAQLGGQCCSQLSRCPLFSELLQHMGCSLTRGY